MLRDVYSWREELPQAFVRGLAVLSGVAVLSVFSAWIVQKPAESPVPAAPERPDWLTVDRPFPAFALSIPEAGDAPLAYAIHRHATGGGRIDTLTLGAIDSDGPALQVNIYRPGTERFRFGEAASEMLARAADLAPADLVPRAEPIETKFGPMSAATFQTGVAQPHTCLGFARGFYDPMLQIFGWFCQPGTEAVSPDTLACALDRFTLLSAGSEPKVGELFAQAELHRNYCGQRNPLLAPTPKHRALWLAITQRGNAPPRNR